MTFPRYPAPVPMTTEAASRPRDASGRVVMAIRVAVAFSSGRGYRKYFDSLSEAAEWLASSPDFSRTSDAVKSVTIIRQDPDPGPEAARSAPEPRRADPQRHRGGGVTLDDRHRCRWHDPGGRCPDTLAFPGAGDVVPPFCVRHLAGLDGWVSARAKAGGATADAWITWAARHAADAEDTLKALGVIRPPRALDDGRPVRPTGPERR